MVKFRQTSARCRAAVRTGLGAAFALQFLADQLARPANSLCLLAGFLLGGLFVEFPALHLAESPLALHLLFQRAERLLDVIVADNDLDQGNTLLLKQKRHGPV